MSVRRPGNKNWEYLSYKVFALLGLVSIRFVLQKLHQARL